jgi:catechol 2,3-dioxygenase-like lactoylglutathione lyase family enzyme
MRVLGIERVALQVKDLDAAVALFSDLLDTRFECCELKMNGVLRRLAFSPLGIELLQEVPAGDFEGLRSFHLRVEDLSEVRPAVIAAGGEVLSEFRVGRMAHLPTQVGQFRIVYVTYSGDDAIAALMTAMEDQQEIPRGGTSVQE